jgi:hypothetical protein
VGSVTGGGGRKEYREWLAGSHEQSSVWRRRSGKLNMVGSSSGPPLIARGSGVR